MPPDKPAVLGLAWALKASFLRYIARMPDGRCSVTDGEEPVEGPSFFFPLKKTINNPEVFEFSGDVRFSGHGGMLFVSICEPALSRTGQHAVLTIRDHETGGRIELATASINVADYTLHGSNVKLTEAGAEIFAGAYTPGESLDDFQPITT